jgi:predicted Fe-Mo cluster-binding NifX family protein
MNKGENMIAGITVNDELGLSGNVSEHFGQCKYFFLAEIEDGKLKSSRVVQNTAVHGGGGCLAVDEIMKHNVSVVISGGMGMGAQQKFAQVGIKVFAFSGKVKDAVDSFIKNSLGNLGSCNHDKTCQ